MQPYSWARRGDVNAFFGLMLDNVAVMVLLISFISVPAAQARERTSGKFSTEFVLTHMIPGTALGVLVGDLVYTVLAFRLARRTGRTDVTAMPLGLDTPSTFAVAFLVLLPALQTGWQRFNDPDLAMRFGWHVGLVVLVLVGIFKVVVAPIGNLVRRLVPRAALLGSLAAIALAMIAFLPLLLDGIAAVPLVGMAALVVILLSLVAHRSLPFQFPGALAAVLIGIGVYQLGRGLEGWFGWPLVPASDAMPDTFQWHPLSLWPWTETSLHWWEAVASEAVGKLPVIFPFALATVVGGIDCTESAAAVGDEYDTGSILMTEGVASLVAGLLGGVIQTTPYIGHPAYKKMGGRAAYTLAAALFIGFAGYFGWFTFLFAWLPKAAMYPILVFVGVEIAAQGFQATPRKHYPALVLAMLPALAYLATVILNALYEVPPVPAKEMGRLQLQTLRCLANGFLITSMLWASMLAMLLDGKSGRAALFLVVAALCTLVGIMHSPLAIERIDLPWNVLAAEELGPMRQALRYQTPYHWAGAYLLMALVVLLLDRRQKEDEVEEQMTPGQENKAENNVSALPSRPGNQNFHQ